MIRIQTVFVAFLIILAVILPVRTARADLSITPIRVVFEGRDRSATVSLLNVTNKTHTYRMRWLEMAMDNDGRYIMKPADDDKNPYSIANMVIYTPRQVTIEPHAYQSIRLSVRRPADLPPGEYRAHLAFTRLAADGPERQDPNQKGKTAALNVNLSFSIPVIVRNGEDKDLKVSLSSPKLAMGGSADKPTPTLHINLDRNSGTFSSYGTIKVFWQPPQGPEQAIGQLTNVALYPELQQRHLIVDLNANPTAGKLRIVYTGKYESEGTTWDEKIFPLGE